MKKNETIIAMLFVAANTVCAQNTNDPVVDYESTAGRNDHIYIKSSSSIISSQEAEINKYRENIKEKRNKLYQHKAERQVKDLERGIGVIAYGYTMTEELKNDFKNYIKNAKRKGKTLNAVYKIRGKEIIEPFEVYITPITPWTGPLDPNEMWDKIPCDRELKRFYMSEKDYFRIFELKNRLEKTIKEVLNNKSNK